MMRKLMFATVLLLAGAIAAIATISSSLNSISLAGNGVQTAFVFPFVGVAAGDISVIYTTSTGTQTTLVQGASTTQYQVSLNAAVAPQLWGIGGTVTYNPSGTPIPSGSTLTIVRTVPYLQLTSLQNQASFGQLAQATEQALDLLAMQLQQVAQSVTRVVQAPVNDPAGLSYQLPAAVQRANLALGFDGSGNVIAIAVPSSGTISSAMQPVVNAASLGAGRIALGLASAAQEAIGSYGMQDDGAGNLRQSFINTSNSTNQTVDRTFHLAQRVCTGPVIYTINRANTLWNGFGFWVINISGTCTLTPDSHDNFRGFASGASINVPLGTALFISTDAASSGIWTVKATPLQILGATVPINLSVTSQLLGMGAPLNLEINASVASNALTVALKDGNGNDPTAASPILVTFRDKTLANGDPVYVAVTAALSITAPTGASFGSSSSNVPFRLWAGICNKAGTAVLTLFNASTPTQIYPLVEFNQVSPTAITSGSTAAGTWYGNVVGTNIACRIIGYLDWASGLTTAGTWASGPTTIHLHGPGGRLPGSVVQRIFAPSTTAATTTSSTFATLSSVLTQAITPTSTPNLIKVTLSGTAANNGGNAAFIQIARVSTLIGNPVGLFAPSSALSGAPLYISTLDAPGTVSSTAYGLQGKIAGGGILSVPPSSTGIQLILEEIMGALDEPANDNEASITSKAA